jgi:hypothetical protein
MDLKKRDEYHQSTARDFLFSTCEAVHTHRRILVQTARVDRDWFSESVARFVDRPMPRLPGSNSPANLGACSC